MPKLNQENKEKYNVVHNLDEARFELRLSNKEIAYVLYKLENNTVDFFSTFVPESQRGQGLAAQLTKVALKWADQQHLRINASCWYVAKNLAGKS